MNRIVRLITLAGLVSVMAWGVGLIAASKAYQFTGIVKSIDGGTLTVEKTAKEVWTFSTDKSTKGTAKVGDKVTVYYSMVATEIETKGESTSAKKPK